MSPVSSLKASHSPHPLELEASTAVTAERAPLEMATSWFSWFRAEVMRNSRDSPGVRGPDGA